MNTTIRAVLASLFLVCAFATQAQDEPGKFRFSTGIDYSSGDYGDIDDTDILYVPFTIRYSRFPWVAKVTLPWLQIEGPGGVVGGGDGPIVIGPADSLTRTTESGIGDMVGSITYVIEPSNSQLPIIDLTAKVKFPTADEDKGLGTGEFDYTFQADASKTFGNLTPLATLGYKIKGSSDTFELENVMFGSAGAAYRFSDAWSAGALLDFQQASSDSSDDGFEIFTYVNRKLDSHWSVNVYGVIGLTDGSPDQGVGLQLSYSP